MELDTDYALSKALLRRYYYKNLKLSIKLWIDEVDQILIA